MRTAGMQAPEQEIVEEEEEEVGEIAPDVPDQSTDEKRE